MTILGALLVQSVSVPAASPPRAPTLAPDPAALSLVIADAVTQVDPKPLCPQPNCTALFLGSFANARTLAGVELPAEFQARMEMGSPFISPYRMAFIVERRPGREMLVRSGTGFHRQTHIGCFPIEETRALGWSPAGPGISLENGLICVKE